MITTSNPILKNLFLTAGLALLSYFSSSGQCSSVSLQDLTYDTLIPGTGNTDHIFSFAKFNPALGTLVAAKISSIVSVNYGFTLQNVESVPRDFTVSVGRIDNFSSSAMSSPYNNLLNTGLGSFLLNPNDSISKPLSNIIYRYVNTDSITSNVANFIGADSVIFYYQPITYTTLFGSVNYYYAASASDTIHFSITYQYCNNITLASILGSFTATKQNWETVELAWKSLNEQAGRNYTIEESNDGRNFFEEGSMPSVVGNNGEGNYTYRYNTLGIANGLLYFRLKIMQTPGQVVYSDVKTVDMGAASTGIPYLYPNPSNQFINIVFNQPANGDWQVELFSSNGSLLETKRFINVSSAHIGFQQFLAEGVYFARLTEAQTRENHVLSFVVR